MIDPWLIAAGPWLGLGACLLAAIAIVLAYRLAWFLAEKASLK